MGGGPNKNAMGHPQQPPPQRHRGPYAPQSHLPPNMTMPPHSTVAYQPEGPPLGPPPPHNILTMPPPVPKMVAVPAPTPQQQQQQPGQKNMISNPLPQRPPRGRDEAVQELKNFQDNYVLAAPQSVFVAAPAPQQSQAAVASVEDKSQVGGVPSPQPAPVPSQAPPPAAVMPSGSAAPAGAAAGDKPEAKKSVLNPHAKSFQPRNSSTPNPSRPHTPQSAGAPQMVPGGPVQLMPGGPNGGGAAQTVYPYLMQSKPFTGRSAMRVPVPTVQAATGSPMYQMYQPPHNPQHFQAPHRLVSMPMPVFTSDVGQPPLPYMATHSTTPSPGAQFQPTPAGAGPSQPFPQAAGQQQPQYQAPIPFLLQSQPMMAPFHPQQYHFLMSPHNPNQ